jgi:hypothetical protein
MFTVIKFMMATTCAAMFVLLSGMPALATEKQDEDFWELHPAFDNYHPNVIAVLPMDNLSLEPEMETHLYNSVYGQLQAKGYRRVSVGRVQEIMREMGIQTAGQLQGISLERLCATLNTDAVLLGQVDQSASIHEGVYDAIVVSCSLRLIDCKTGTVLWRSEQWRTAHRQWQIDPFNALINLAAHASSSREDRIAWLVQEMLKTLPAGKVNIELDNLLKQAKEITIQAE